MRNNVRVLDQFEYQFCMTTMLKTCDVCGLQKPKMKKCPICKERDFTVYVCSAACFAKNWPMHRIIHDIQYALLLIEGADRVEEGLRVLRDLSAEITKSDVLISAGAIDIIVYLTRSDTAVVKKLAGETVYNLSLGSNSMKMEMVSFGIVEGITSDTSIENKVLMHTLSNITNGSDIATMRRIVSGGSIPHFLRFIQVLGSDEEESAMIGLKNIILYGNGDEEFRHAVVMAGAVGVLVERSRSVQGIPKYMTICLLTELASNCRKGNWLKMFVDEGAIDLFLELAKDGANGEKAYAAQALVNLTRVAAGEKGAHLELVSSGTLDKIIITLHELSQGGGHAIIDDILVVTRNILRGVYRREVHDTAFTLFFHFVGDGTSSQKKISMEGLLDMASEQHMYASVTQVEQILQAVRAKNIDACLLLECMAKRKKTRRILMSGGAVSAIFAAVETSDSDFRNIAYSALVNLHKTADVDELKTFLHLLLKSKNTCASSRIYRQNVKLMYDILKSQHIIEEFQILEDGNVQIFMKPEIAVLVMPR